MDESVRASLKCCRLFQDLPDPLLWERVLPLGTLRSFDKRAALISPQERVERFGVVVEGEIHILQLFADGAHSMLDALRPSYVLGMDLLFTATRRSPYYAVAAAPTRVLFFPGALLTEPGALPEEARVALLQRLLLMLSQENMHKYYRLAILAQRGVRKRVLTYLSMQAGKRGCTTFEVPFSREELAAFLCVDRSVLSHELSLMQRDGLLRFHKNRFTLLEAGKRSSGWEA